MKRILLIAALALLVAGVPALAGGNCADKAAKASKGEMASKVESKIENLENGVKVTLISNDAEVVKAVQKEARTFLAGQCASQCPMKSEGAAHQVADLDNGVVITATAGCPDKVKQIQEYAQTRLKDGAFLQTASAPKAATAS